MEKKIEILYIDDEPVNLMLFKVNFDKKYSVYTAESGFSGLDILDKKPDILVVISDMKMPGMNGIEFIKKAKKLYPNKKFYILTGYEITSEIRVALDSGLILKYFSKPFDINDIDSALEDAIKL
ncbi:MAG: response regulator [Bacteroidales bacterium]|nr:response regulator [Bacteroidales bacterium]